MPELKYVVTADDSEAQKVLNRVRKKAKETTSEIVKDFDRAAQKAIKLEVNQGDRATIASGSVAGEHAKRGAIANEAFARSAQKATTATREQTSATNAQGAATQTTTTLQNAQMKSIEQLTIKLEAYKRIAATSTDPQRLTLYNQKIQQTQAQITQLSNVGKQGFDRFGNAIVQNQNLMGKMYGSVKMLASLLPGLGIAGVLAFAIEPLMDWIKGLDILGNKFRKIAAEGVGSAEYKKALSDVVTLRSNLEIAENGVISKTKVVKEYNETLGKTQGHLKTIEQVQQWEQKNAAKYLEYMGMKTQAQVLFAAATDKAAESAKKMIEGPGIADYAKATLTNFFGGPGLFSIEGVKAEAERRNIEAAAKDKKSFDELVKQAQEMQIKALNFAKKNGLGVDEIETKDHKKALDARLSREKSLMAEITKIRMDASRKQLEGQAADLQVITDKYDLITKKVQDFFTDPKNKGTKLNVGQIFSDLAIAENQEQATIAKKYAEEQAKKRDEEAKEARAHFQELLNEFETFESQKLRILSDANTAADKLIKEGYEEEAKVAIDRANNQISELEQANIKKLESYRNLFDNLATLTKSQTLEAIKNVRAELNEYKASASAKEAILKILAELERKTNDEIGKDSQSNEKKRIQELNEALSALRLIATEFDNLNDDLGKVSAILLSSAKAYVEIKENISVLNSKEASTTQKLAAGTGILGAALGVANAVAGYFKGLKAAKEAAKKAMSDFQQEAIKGEQEYQALLRKRDLDTVARGKSTYQALIAQLETLKKQSPEIQKAYEKVFAALQGQSSVEGVGYRNGTWLRKAKTWDIMASLAGADYDRLEKLYSEGKLKDQAKADFEALRTLRDELEAAGLSVQSLQDQLKSLLTGTTAGGLADSLSQLFQNGKFAAQDFGDSFEEIMKNAIVNSFKYKVMEDAMKPFYDEFASLFLNGTPTESDIDALKEKYEAIGLQLGDQFKELERITGRSLTTKDQSGTGNTMAGAISSIRAEQADLLAARLGGIQLSNLEMLSIQRQQLDMNRQCYQIAMNALNTYLAIERNTLRTADNTERLKGIETAIVSMEKKVSSNANAAIGLNGFGG